MEVNITADLVCMGWAASVLWWCACLTCSTWI